MTWIRLIMAVGSLRVAIEREGAIAAWLDTEMGTRSRDASLDSSGPHSGRGMDTEGHERTLGSSL